MGGGNSTTGGVVQVNRSGGNGEQQRPEGGGDLIHNQDVSNSGVMTRGLSLRDMKEQAPKGPQNLCTDPKVEGQWESRGGAARHDQPWKKLGSASEERLEKAFLKFVVEDSSSENSSNSSCSIVIGGKMHTVCFKTWTKKGPGGKGSLDDVRRVDKMQAQIADSFHDPFGQDEVDATGLLRHSSSMIASPIPKHQGGSSSSTTDAGGGEAETNGEYSSSAAVLCSTIDAHDDSIYTISLSAEGDKIAAGCKNGSVKVFELSTGFVTREFERVAGNIICVAMSKTKPLVASGADDDLIRIYNVQQSSEAPIATLEGHEHKVYSVVFASNHKNLLSGSMDGTVRQWDLATGKESRMIDAHEAAIFATCGGPQNSSLVLSAADDNLCKMHDLRLPDNSCTTATLKGHSKTLWGCDIRFDEMEFATCGMDGSILTWDPRKLEAPIKMRIRSHGTHAVHWVEYMPEGHALLSSSRDKTWRMTNVSATQPEEIVQVAKAHSGNVFRVMYNAVTNQVVTCSSDKKVKVWKLN